MIEVLIADDHHLVRAGIRSLLEKLADIEVVGEAVNGLQAVEMVGELRPHIVIMDIGMPILNGHEAASRIKAQNSECEIIILSMHSEPLIVRRALDMGARGYLLKSSLEDELPMAIRAVMQHEVYLSPGIANVILDDYLIMRHQQDSTSPIDLLTTRERQLLQLIAEGRTNREISQIMEIGERTVEKHRANMMDKLNIHDVAGLVRLAIRNGLVTLDDQ